ncbi:hypothetical protein C4D60_Mb01t19830 [Musa balbisiana]|uniref:Uncharacterized protein n=1 Tax=Musa balbisiana TaxID=52838 RepID=A0A4V4H7G8_MUSBA|nr:hypothetical protein C4D60_Mb01t19830 [Musa balbisiana]
MAQSVLMASNGGRSLSSTMEPLLQAQIHRLRPTRFSDLLLPRTPRRHRPSTSSSSFFPALALFKAKTKAPPAKVETKKPKVEDGIFGTSGGIGFTKQNELFVGRVAMLGFAVSILRRLPSHSNLSYSTRSYPQASLLGEGITGKGILAQLNLETGIPIYEAEPLLLFFILFTLLGAIGALGDRGQFVDDSPTGLGKAVIPPGKGFRAAMGLKEGGKVNHKLSAPASSIFFFLSQDNTWIQHLDSPLRIHESERALCWKISAAGHCVLHNRIGEIITGKGALAQLNIETGVPVSELEPLVLFNVAFFFFAALNPGTGKFVTDEVEE